MIIKKEDLAVVDMEFMNDVHYEDVKIINELFELVLTYEKEPSDENDISLSKKYQEWISHTVEHFKGEEVLMQEKQFPAYEFHKGEHDNALKIMYGKFQDFQENNDISILKIYLIQELPSWLIQHIATMDTITARFFKTGISPCSIAK